jgi:hypothetical protein
MKRLLRILVSLAVSGGILWLLFREAEKPARSVAQALWTMGLGVWVAYAVAQVVQGWLRAVRYRLLLQGAGVRPLPGRGRMFGVTLARNMFVDMLPARTGELMYWALLNRGEGVENEDCVSSMTLSVWFDFLALLAVLGFALGVPMLEAQGRVLLVWGMIVVAAVVAVGWVALFYGPGWAARIVEALPARAKRWKPLAWVEGFMEKLARSFEAVRGSGVLLRAVALSVVIRAVKYAGLGVAFYGVARVLRPALAELPLWQVLVGLISGEGGAALPVPTVLSMGTYEAAGSGALGLTGVSVEDAGLVLLGTHVASQLIDYAMGGLGLLGLLWGRRSAPPTDTAVPAPEAGRTNPVFLAWIFMIILAIASGATWTWRQQQKTGSKEAPGAGAVITMGRGELAKLDDVWGDRAGFIVWSSTMYGQHELVRFEWPSGRLVRLTEDPHVDRSPKISPDGKRVVFARSREEWVSFRNRNDWDIWVMNLRSRKARLVAERGAQPEWTPDGQGVVFHRGGRELIQVDLKSGKETVLLGPQEGVYWETPSLDPQGDRVAVTIRGKRRATALVTLPEGKVKRVAGGCQFAFVPGGDWLVVVLESGGEMKNRICRVDREGKKVETLLDMPLPWSHEYFPRVSNDGSLLVFGAAREGHEHDTADYEIFLWRIGDAPGDAARVSFHTGNDQWPDVWVYPPR